MRVCIAAENSTEGTWGYPLRSSDESHLLRTLCGRRRSLQDRADTGKVSIFFKLNQCNLWPYFLYNRILTDQI